MLRDTDTHLMQAATLTNKPSLESPGGAVTAGEPNRCPSLPACLLHLWAKSKNFMEATVTASELHRSGQTEGATTVKQLVKPAAEVRHDYKDGAVDRGLGKLLVVLTKVQD